MVQSVEKIENKPEINFYCMKCNVFFSVKDGTLLDDIKCPECSTYEVFLELDFKEKETPNYYS